MPLVVYKSSAGSGKTYTLVKEYLRITLKNPEIFRNVLAITFTNKAANEMKSRVLKTLYLLASGEGIPKELMEYLETELKMDEANIRRQAQKLHSLILQRYEEFAVSTIDSFVHSIVRTFANDVKLPQNFEVVIENEDFVPEILERLFDKIGTNKALTELLINFVFSQVDDQKSYDPSKLLYDFIQKQLGEDSYLYLKKIEHLSSADFLLITKKLRSLLVKGKETINNYGNSALQLIRDNNLTPDLFFQGKNGICLYFTKLSKFHSDVKVLEPGNNAIKTVEEDKWYGGKATQADRNKIDGLKDSLSQIFEESRSFVNEYIVYKLLFRKIYNLALHNEIRELINTYMYQTQRVHISEFNKKIGDEIAGQPVPFIYERLGRRYKYFLLDEFQDTSLLQWSNLLPLVEESLSNGNFNMLVGDSKQAIYRFRNGEVELFASLPDLYLQDGLTQLPERSRLIKSAYQERFLDTNYRSKSEIVNFNNQFFQAAKDILDERNRNFYDHHEQKVKNDTEKIGGFVSIEFLESANAEEYHLKRLDKIRESIELLMKSGKKQSDICVLSNSNRNAAEVAAYLAENNYRIISPESLLLTNSPAVRLITSVMYLLTDPEQEIYLTEFIASYLLLNKKENDFHSYFSKIKECKGELKKVFQLAGLNFDPDVLRPLGIYEMVEKLVRELSLNHENDPYLHYFLDYVFENQDREGGKLEDFLERWEEKKLKASVITPESEDAISIMTIHKAKGLDFDSVIVDIASFQNKTGKSDLWTVQTLDEISELDVLLFPSEALLEKTNLADLYLVEKEKTEFDFINMLYVAFTRAVDALIILCQKKEKGENKLMTYLDNYLKLTEGYDEKKISYQWGTISESQERKGEKSISVEKLISTDWHKLVIDSDETKKISEIFQGETARETGNKLHEIFSLIHTEKDINRILLIKTSEGILSESEIPLIKNLLLKTINHPALKQWYSSDVIVRNESEIIDTAGGKIHRPDRVAIMGEKVCVIDYKTGEKKEDHFNQIQQYSDLLRELGYRDIKRKLVYLTDEVEVVEV